MSKKKEKIKRIVCPFCGEEATVVRGKYKCKGCGYDHTDDEREREEIRQRISAICSRFNAVEDKPLSCDNISISGIDEPAQGLSDSLLPHVVNVFHCPEGIVWATIEGSKEPVDLSEVTVTDSLELLLWHLEEKYNIQTSGINDDYKVIEEGSLVRWHDPEIECQDLTIIWEVARINGDVVLITNEGGEAEVFADELELVK